VVDEGPAALVRLSMLLLVLFERQGWCRSTSRQVLAALVRGGRDRLERAAVLAWLRGTSPAGAGELVVLLAAALACSAAVVVALRAETEPPVMHFTAGVLAVAAWAPG
jgi:hypothetical protein